MLMGTLGKEMRKLRIYAITTEAAIRRLPVGPMRNEAITALAGVDQKMAALSARAVVVEKEIVEYFRELPDSRGGRND